MAHYKNILIAVDLDEVNTFVVARAKEVAGDNARFHLVHVIEPIQIQGPIPAIDYSNIHQHTEEYAKSQLAELGKTYLIDADCQYVLDGAAKREIQKFADQNGIDLIVIGSHGRHGVSLLLGSTANAVLHGANCDVLAVRV